MVKLKGILREKLGKALEERRVRKAQEKALFKEAYDKAYKEALQIKTKAKAERIVEKARRKAESRAEGYTPKLKRLGVKGLSFGKQFGRGMVGTAKDIEKAERKSSRGRSDPFGLGDFNPFGLGDFNVDLLGTSSGKRKKKKEEPFGGFI